MEILFAVIMAVIGMLVVMGFLFLLVILLNGLRIVNTFKENRAAKKNLSSAPRTKVASRSEEDDADVVKEDAPAAVDGGVSLDDEEEQIRQVLAAAVSTYLLLKEKDARKQSDKRRRRNVWSIAGKYEILSQRMTGGEGHNF